MCLVCLVLPLSKLWRLCQPSLHQTKLWTNLYQPKHKEVPKLRNQRDQRQMIKRIMDSQQMKFLKKPKWRMLNRWPFSSTRLKLRLGSWSLWLQLGIGSSMLKRTKKTPGLLVLCGWVIILNSFSKIHQAQIRISF